MSIDPTEDDYKVFFDGIVAAIARSLKKQKEELLTKVITDQLGTEDWKILDIAPRGQFFESQDGSEIFSLDGVDLVQFFPARVEIEDSGEQIVAKAKQPFRLLYDQGTKH